MPLALLPTADLIGWYHSIAYRADRSVAVAPSFTVRKRIVLVAPQDGALADALGGIDGFTVHPWVRTDSTAEWSGPLEDLVTRIAAADGEDVLVIVAAEEPPAVIPYRAGERHERPAQRAPPASS